MTDRWSRGVAAGALLLVPAALVQLPVAHDEAYYWTWSKALSPSYLDHPPGVAVAIAAARAALGDGALALRVASGLAMVLTVLWTAQAARETVLDPAHPGVWPEPERRGRRAAWLGALTLLGAVMFTVGYLPATPDPFQGATLALASLGVGRAMRGASGWGAVGALALGASILVKQSSGLVAAGALLAALTSVDGRRALTRPAVLLGAMVAAAAVGAWLAVDLAAGGATDFQRAKVFADRQARGVLGVPLTFGALLLTAGPAAGFALVTLMLRGLAGRLSPLARVRVGGASALVVACCVAAGYGAGEVNWVLPAAVFAAPTLAGWALEDRARTWRYRWASIVSAFCGLVVLAHIVYPFAPLPPRKDRTLRAVGFSSVAKVVDAQMQRHDARVVVTRRYQFASQLRFHLQDRYPVLEVGGARRSQYDRWPHPRLCPGDVAVLAWNRRDLPPGLEAEPLAPVETAARERAGRAQDPIFVQPIRVTRSRFCREEGAP